MTITTTTITIILRIITVVIIIIILLFFFFFLLLLLLLLTTLVTVTDVLMRSPLLLHCLCGYTLLQGTFGLVPAHQRISRGDRGGYMRIVSSSLLDVSSVVPMWVVIDVDNQQMIHRNLLELTKASKHFSELRMAFKHFKNDMPK